LDIAIVHHRNYLMKSSVIRQMFIDFFVSHGHEHISSSSLIPAQDPTLLFANAGMNQFKDLFLGLEKRSYTRAVSIQKCVRAGGKHNDLDNVGFTKRHLTFFEMMGNFSFGDYFKKKAIVYAWNFLTRDIGLDQQLLHVSVHHTDHEAFELWQQEIGLPSSHIHRLGDADNFWQMGDIGPCGPCTEIYIDRGITSGCGVSTCSPACGCDRFLEIWNLVFMQYDRQSNGTLKELTQKGVDTGMGFERLCAIVQHQDSVFTTDLFTPIIHAIEKYSGIEYATASIEIKPAFHVLADHIRSCSFLIADGCAPSNEGRGYVLRKIIRRAALFAQKLSDSIDFFPSLSHAVVEQMDSIYPVLHTNQKLIHAVLISEIERFAVNLNRGTQILTHFFTLHADTKVIPGKDVFVLYDTYGFPVELTAAAARERGYSVDMPAYEQCMSQQKEQSAAAHHTQLEQIELPTSISTEFTGYYELTTTSPISALIVDGQLVQSVAEGSPCHVVTQKSPFFVVGGGQVPDQGWFELAHHQNSRTPVLSVQHLQKAIVVEIVAPRPLTIGEMVTSTVDPVFRTNTMKNHTATHLLQAALITLFGKHIKQAGSVVHPDYLRFDFTYHTSLSSDDIATVENLVNEKIRENIPVTVSHTTLREATQQGVIAFFGDKYNPDNVRVIKMDDFSAELCGGTHVQRTGDIGTFKIIEVAALAAGHRRILALTGPKAIEHYQAMFAVAKGLSQEFSVKPEEVPTAVMKQKEELRTILKRFSTAQRALWMAKLPLWQQEIQIVHGIPAVCIIEPELTSEDARTIAAQLLTKRAGFYCVISNNNERAQFVIRIAPEYLSKIDIFSLAAWLKKEHGLKGGGKAGELQGGGPAVTSTFKNALYAWLHAN
jgi:alanyl-tRNA synthetase